VVSSSARPRSCLRRMFPNRPAYFKFSVITCESDNVVDRCGGFIYRRLAAADHVLRAVQGHPSRS
jgi:hypothetical protein